MNTNYVETLKNIVFFTGPIIMEQGLLKGSFTDTSDQCDPKSFMDIAIKDHPEVVVVLEKDEQDNWKVSGGRVGIAEDGLSPIDNELVAGWVLQELGKPALIKSEYVEELRTPGPQYDEAYFIPNFDENSGLIIRQAEVHVYAGPAWAWEFLLNNFELNTTSARVTNDLKEEYRAAKALIKPSSVKAKGRKTYEGPDSAWDTFWEATQLDMESISCTKEYRHNLRKAYDAVYRHRQEG